MEAHVRGRYAPSTRCPVYGTVEHHAYGQRLNWLVGGSSFGTPPSRMSGASSGTSKVIKPSAPWMPSFPRPLPHSKAGVADCKYAMSSRYSNCKIIFPTRTFVMRLENCMKSKSIASILRISTENSFDRNVWCFCFIPVCVFRGLSVAIRTK